MMVLVVTFSVPLFCFVFRKSVFLNLKPDEDPEFVSWPKIDRIWPSHDHLGTPGRPLWLYNHSSRYSLWNRYFSRWPEVVFRYWRSNLSDKPNDRFPLNFLHFYCSQGTKVSDYIMIEYYESQIMTHTVECHFNAPRFNAHFYGKKCL